MWNGFWKASPLAIGVAAYGLAVGALAAQAGFSLLEVIAMGFGVFAGVAQIMAVERFAADAGWFMAFVTAAALNVRYIAILASISPVLRAAPVGWRVFAAHLTADENWALTMSQRANDPTIGWQFHIGAGLAIIIAWVGASALGTSISSTGLDLKEYGISFAFTAAFIALARGMWRRVRDLLPWSAAGLAAIATLFLTENHTAAILLGTALGTSVGILRGPPASGSTQ